MGNYSSLPTGTRHQSEEALPFHQKPEPAPAPEQQNMTHTTHPNTNMVDAYGDLPESTTSHVSEDSSSSSSNSDDVFEDALMDPYDDDGDDEEEAPYPPRSPGSTTTAAAAAATSTISSECYRWSIFRKKSNPLTILHASASDDDDDDDGGEEDDHDHDGRSSISTCFPSRTLAPPPVSPRSTRTDMDSSSSSRRRTPLSSSSSAATTTAVHGVKNSQKSGTSRTLWSSGSPSFSFQHCREGFFDTEDEDDHAAEYETTGCLSSPSPSTAWQEDTSLQLGCVSSPLRSSGTNRSGTAATTTSSSSSSSWTNLVGLTETDTLEYTVEERDLVDGALPTPESNLHPPRDYWIVTTAALPWMTGTAVNPLLRAAYLSQRNRHLASSSSLSSTSSSISSSSTVTLVVPWLENPVDRIALYGSDWHAATPARQDAYIRTWLRESAQLPEEADEEAGGIAIQWYPARYHAALSSIFAMGDLCELIPPNSHDMVCILEEPEHVNFYRAPGRWSWRDKFPHVVGIVHTNYKAYARNHYSGLLTGPLVGALSSLMVRAYCDKIVKLSPVLQPYAPYKEVVSNVHGIRQEFFRVAQTKEARGRVYFIGKLLWAKGLDKLLDLQASYRKTTGSYFGMDIYGSGPQQDEIESAFLGQDELSSRSSMSSGTSNGTSSSSSDPTNATTATTISNSDHVRRYWRRFQQPVPARFLGRRDHAAIGEGYQIFVNPSITEVLCTTTAEAIAMGKWALIPKHASNEFFLPFGNCLQYTSRREFVELFQYCQTHDPPGWDDSNDNDNDNLHGSNNDDVDADTIIDRSVELFPAMSWQAATQRLIDTAYLTRRDAQRCQRLQPNDRNIQEWHRTLGEGTRGDVIRKVLGGGPVAGQSHYAV